MAKAVRIINKYGNLTGWNNVTVNVLGRDLETITEIDYSDEIPKEAVYGAGRMPVGFAEGNYSAKASISINNDEVQGILESMPAEMRIQDIPPFPILVVYEFGQKVVKDIIHNCSFVNNGKASKQGEGKIEIKFDLFTTHIQFNAI